MKRRHPDQSTPPQDRQRRRQPTSPRSPSRTDGRPTTEEDGGRTANAMPSDSGLVRVYGEDSVSRGRTTHERPTATILPMNLDPRVQTNLNSDAGQQHQHVTRPIAVVNPMSQRHLELFEGPAAADIEHTGNEGLEQALFFPFPLPLYPSLWLGPPPPLLLNYGPPPPPPAVPEGNRGPNFCEHGRDPNRCFHFNCLHSRMPRSSMAAVPPGPSMSVSAERDTVMRSVPSQQVNPTNRDGEDEDVVSLGCRQTTTRASGMRSTMVEKVAPVVTTPTPDVSTVNRTSSEDTPRVDSSREVSSGESISEGRVPSPIHSTTMEHRESSDDEEEKNSEDSEGLEKEGGKEIDD